MAGFWDPMAKSLGQAGGFIADVWNGTNNGTRAVDSINRGNAAMKSAWQSATTKPSSPVSKTPSSSNSDWARESQSLMAQIAALNNQIAQQPKLPNFDILANYTKAKQTATQAVNPLYDKKLNLFLEGQGIKKNTATKQRDLTFENSNIALQNQLTDNMTGRTRTGEDLANVLGAIGQQRENFLVDDAQQFDDARRAASEEIAAGGATDTGLGQQALQRQLEDRNTNAARTETELRNQEETKKMLATRTIDDLATSDLRSTQKKGQEDKATKLDFDSLMAEMANEEKSYRLTNDLERAMEISRQTDSYAKQGSAQFIANLAKQGWRAQDIALASQVYM